MATQKVEEKLNEVLDVAKDLLDDDFLESEGLLPEVPTEPERPMALRQPKYDDDLANDYQTTRDVLNSLVTKAELALDGLLQVARASDHPRAYEVAANLIKTISEVTKDLIGLQKTMRDIKSSDDESGNVNIENAENVTNQTIVFTGTTKELQMMIKDAKNSRVIEDE